MFNESATQLLEGYRTRGFVFVEGLLSSEQLRKIRRNLDAVLSEPWPLRFLEQDGVTVRAIQGLQAKGGVWKEVAERSVVPRIASMLLGEASYVYQWKINPKYARTGDEWKWHRDFTYWREDGMPAPHAITAAIALDDVDEQNGPLRVISGSHRIPPLPEERHYVPPVGEHEESHGAQMDSKSRPYTIRDATVEDLARQHGIFDACGAAGSVLFFSCNIIHGSTHNHSDRDRTLALITYNPFTNAPPAVDLGSSPAGAP